MPIKPQQLLLLLLFICIGAKAQERTILLQGYVRDAFTNGGIKNVSVILMDEPTSGLDPFIRKEVLNLIVQDVSSRSTSVLISTHNVSELEQICDTVGFINKGEMKLQQDMDNLKTSYKKIQIAFKDEMSEEFKKEFKPHISKKHGKIYEIIVNMDYEVFESNVKKYQPLFVEHIDMTLEEIFLFKMGDDNYVKQVTI